MATRRNLCINPALDVDASGWGGASTPARTDVTGLGFDRTWAARYTAGTHLQTSATDVGAITPGVTYTLSVSVRTASFSAGGNAYIEWLNSGGGGFGYPSVSYSVPAPDTVVRVSITAAAPAGAVRGRLILDGVNYAINATDATTVLIEPEPTLGTYFDGNSPSAAWDGTAGLSSSTLTDTPVSAVTARGCLALGGVLAARKVAPGAGQTAAGLAGVSTARKVATATGVVSVALAGSGGGRKAAVASGAAATALAGVGTARKGVSTTGRGAVVFSGATGGRKSIAVAGASCLLMGGYHARISRAVAGVSSLALAGRGVVRKVAPTAGYGVLLLAPHMNLVVVLPDRVRLSASSAPLIVVRGEAR